MTVYRFIAVLALALLLLAKQAVAEEGLPGQLQRFMAGFESLSAGFEQRLLNQYGEELESSRGVLHILRPGKFHWSYVEPYEQYLVSNGQLLWVYDADLEQVTIREVDDILEDSPAAILGGDVDIERHYIVIAEEKLSDIDWIELTPRDLESQYSAIRIGFEGELLSRMVLFDSLGQTTQIVLYGIEWNKSLPPDLFEFTPPQGVDVIDSRE